MKNLSFSEKPSEEKHDVEVENDSKSIQSPKQKEEMESIVLDEVTLMRRSQIADTSRIYEYNQDVWIVSLLVSSPTKKGEHARIIIEGVTDEGEFFYNESHIHSILDARKLNSISTQVGLVNHEGTYTIISTDYNSYREDKMAEYTEGKKISWCIRKERAECILREVQREKEHISNMLQEINQLAHDGRLEEAQQLQKKLPKYQYSGDRQLKFLGGNGGHNCVTWCQEKLSFADIDAISAPLDALKASPKKQVHPLKKIRDNTKEDIQPSPEITSSTSLYAWSSIGAGALLISSFVFFKPESARNVANSIVSYLSPKFLNR